MKRAKRKATKAPATKKWTTKAGKRVRTPAARAARKARNVKKGFYPNPIKAAKGHAVRVVLDGRVRYFAGMTARGVLLDDDPAKARALTQDGAGLVEQSVTLMMIANGHARPKVDAIPHPKR